MVADEMPEKKVIPTGILARQPDQPGQHARHLDHGQVPQQFARGGISSRTMMFSDLLSSCGNGCAGSSASGVSTGRTWDW